MKAELGVCYTLEEFRKNEMPDEENSLLFRLNNETVDCDIGDLEVSKFRPVKIKVGDREDPVWARSECSHQGPCHSIDDSSNEQSSGYGGFADESPRYKAKSSGSRLPLHRIALGSTQRSPRHRA